MYKKILIYEEINFIFSFSLNVYVKIYSNKLVILNLLSCFFLGLTLQVTYQSSLVNSPTNQNGICLLSIAFVMARSGRSLLVKVCCRYSFLLLWGTLWLLLVTSHPFATIYYCQFWRMELILIVQMNSIS